MADKTKTKLKLLFVFLGSIATKEWPLSLALGGGRTGEGGDPRLYLGAAGISGRGLRVEYIWGHGYTRGYIRGQRVYPGGLRVSISGYSGYIRGISGWVYPVSPYRATGPAKVGPVFLSFCSSRWCSSGFRWLPFFIVKCAAMLRVFGFGPGKSARNGFRVGCFSSLTRWSGSQG